MATTATMASPVLDLTDDQVEQLLQAAEVRLAARHSGPNETSLTTTKVTSKTELATVDSQDKKKARGSIPAPSDEKPKLSDKLSVRVPQQPLSKKQKTAKDDAGAAWFNMPKTDLTPQLKRDLQLLKMRGVLDPKRHYRKDNSKLSVPEYSHVGTLIEGPTEFYSARMAKKDRKRTLLEEVLETEDTTRRFKSKYGEIQAAKTSGKKGNYKKLMEKRYGPKKR